MALFFFFSVFFSFLAWMFSSLSLSLSFQGGLLHLEGILFCTRQRSNKLGRMGVQQDGQYRAEGNWENGWISGEQQQEQRENKRRKRGIPAHPRPGRHGILGIRGTAS